ncbi:fumarylacetoacetate hydrolase family protein [Neorhizobium alkalisoli]|uniref:2-keto-4-pentenoate hydratase/2-oxohepta-3-ene-1,7-dioic acid hydratase in catechol pathway n=1 Tax=Neorhizobium alkalisoli TaxID=528178 RepID=A0A561R973_9HYPH|nr:fumarylacetoacetate hydrolase family protein [Neorhizobium alkalisoli]TWF59156.1 2-keto-4-pentenoate hydratase/2-oxohepta-3-ene-1,7-dioic acid hydratase in catechol pathway [Neorhizobium alkalisoli]
MKFVRFGESGKEKPGVVDDQGKIRDLSGLVTDITGDALGGKLSESLKHVDISTLPLAPEGARLGPCIAQVGNFIAVGLNYADHATETNAQIPKEPILFNKARSCIVGPYDDVVLPPNSTKSDWEVEIAFVISKRASYVSEDEALDHVGGYFICNDVSEREYQLEREGQWVKGKCCPTFGPIGPWVVTPDEVGNPQDLSLWLEVNGERLQNSTTRNMIFPIRTLVSYISQYMILEPGDIVTTGTPPGVGLGMVPLRFLKRGDTMKLGVEKLGIQEQRVI